MPLLSTELSISRVPPRISPADKPEYVERVLDVEKGQLCYIIGTIYMDMPLKPNVLADLGKEVSSSSPSLSPSIPRPFFLTKPKYLNRQQWVTAPPPLSKFHSPSDSVLLEDDSGRIKLVGNVISIRDVPLVTGVIMAVLGVESGPAGEFEVVDCCFAGLAPPPPPSPPGIGERMDVDGEANGKAGGKGKGKWIALLSGLDIASNAPISVPLTVPPTSAASPLASATPTTTTPATTTPLPPQGSEDADVRLQLLIEYLKGESGGEDEQAGSKDVECVVVLGNSLDAPRKGADDVRNSVRFPFSSTFASVLLIRCIPIFTLCMDSINW